MLESIVAAQVSAAPAATLTRTLLDGATLYGASGQDKGRLSFAVTVAYSEGVLGAATASSGGSWVF